MKAIFDIAEFLWKLRTRLRFGELSRAPLQLLRFEVAAENAKCEWLAREPDPWDADLDAELRLRNATLQALQDAVAMREMLFTSIPEVREAKFRVYRQADLVTRDLIIAGLVSRDDVAPPRLSSIAMRAKLYGLHFSLERGALEPLLSECTNFEFATAKASTNKH